MKIHDRLVLRVKADAYKCMNCCFYSKGKRELTMQEREHYDCGEENEFTEIKQNKEDMKEKKLNLKPFDIQKAREGNPVCARDGRKARIICFDRDWDRNIVALVSGPLGESVHCYLSNGKVDFEKQDYNDLMMLPEKKKGWVNVYQGGKLDADYLYPSKEDAVENIFPPMKDKYIDTIKLTWEE